MSISSSLKSFSLLELFRLIEVGSKSGRLIVQTPKSEHTAKLNGIYYVWFKEGYLVAVSDRLNYKGLISLIEARGWLSPAIVGRLRTLCPPEVPLGVYLQKNRLLNKEQLSLMFQLQLHHVYQLFNYQLLNSEGGQFKFEELAELQDRILTIPWLEMTGQKIKTTEVSMYALRLAEKWNIFNEQLPEPYWAVKRLVRQPNLKLTALERQLWELADGETCLDNISKISAQSLRDIQIIAFRLIAVGLVEKVVVSGQNWHKLPQLAPQNHGDLRLLMPSSPSMDSSLIKNLLQFLKRKLSKEC